MILLIISWSYWLYIALVSNLLSFMRVRFVIMHIMISLLLLLASSNKLVMPQGENNLYYFINKEK